MLGASAGEPAATDDPSRIFPSALDGSGGDLFSPCSSPKNSWRVLKFGGSSVADASTLLAAARIVVGACRKRSVLVVVSALQGVTDSLEEALAQAGSPKFSPHGVCRALGRRHGALLASVARGEPSARAGRALARELEGLEELLIAARQGSLEQVGRAQALAAGERLSAPIFAAALQSQVLPAVAVDAAELLVVRGPGLDADPDLAATRRRVAARLPLLESLVVVVPGFYGRRRNGPALLGRGGSDTSATALGAALGADRVEIWTDVDGVYPRDPRLDSSVSPFPFLGFDHAEAIAAAGARVLHAKSIAPAREQGVPIVVCNTFRPWVEGTWIGPAEASGLVGQRLGAETPEVAR